MDSTKVGVIGLVVVVLIVAAAIFFGRRQARAVQQAEVPLVHNSEECESCEQIVIVSDSILSPETVVGVAGLLWQERAHGKFVRKAYRDACIQVFEVAKDHEHLREEPAIAYCMAFVPRDVLEGDR